MTLDDPPPLVEDDADGRHKARTNGKGDGRMEPVRWGILSTANIGRVKVVPGMMKSPLLKVVAVASRDEATAREMASELGIPDAYGSYEALLAAPEIEAI